MSIRFPKNRNFFNFPMCFYFFAILLIIEKCTAYTPPKATVEPLYPKGLRISVPHEPGISLVAYHVKFNEDFYSLEAGTISIDIIKPRNGRWLYEDRTTELKEGDTIYFWVHVVYQGLGYNLLNQEHRVTGFVNYDGTPVRSQIDKETCTLSTVTKVFIKGQQQESCRGQLIFEENFDTLNLTRWTPIERFSMSPDYEFVVYTNSEDNVKVSNGRLRITPTFLEDKYGVGYVRRGTLILDRCTATIGGYHCQREAVGSYILPPIMSGQLSTKGNFAFQYGRIEVRAKLPQGDWIYPVINLETDSYDRKNYTQPQIRIASAAGNLKLTSKEGTDLSGHVLWAGALPPVPIGEDLHKNRLKLSRRSSPDTWSDDFHSYELEWRNDRVLVKVDGITYGEQSVTAPFDKPFYINLGVAVGGRVEFADSCSSDNYKKPWRNVASKALLDFYEARDNWSRTWDDNKKSLEVDYVKVWAI